MNAVSSELRNGNRENGIGSIPHVEGLVSVIIPNYNHAQYLGEAIQSVLNQDYQNFEIIVVDDGSTDNSQEVITSFGNRVQYIWQENRGLSAARNTGIRAAKGDFIGVLDADDKYEPNFMSTLVSILVENPDADGVYCGYQFVDHLDNPLPQREARLIPANQLYKALVDGNFLVPESVLVRRHCYENIGFFDETLSACEDLDMWLRITHQYNIKGTNRVLTRHRISPDSMSTNPNRQYKNRLAVIAKHFGSEPDIRSTWKREQRWAYGKAYLASTVEFLQAQNFDRAYECLRKIAIISPNLLTQPDTFYELGLGEQPKGYRCDFQSLDIDKNAIVLIRMLDRLFKEPAPLIDILDYRDEIYANAYFALGLLSYGARQLQMARRYFLQVLKMKPKYGTNEQLIGLFLKSLLGVKAINFFKQKKKKFSELYRTGGSLSLLL